MDYFIQALKQYADFKGRTTRKEYWMFILFYLIFNIVAALIDNMLVTEMFSIILGLALFVPSISIAARRLHDTGRSGWWQLISLIPIIGLIVLIVFLAQKGQDDNDYGNKPENMGSLV